jgi:lipoprotein-anchoring transpeptidase ErfK/SrfK
MPFTLHRAGPLAGALLTLAVGAAPAHAQAPSAIPGKEPAQRLARVVHATQARAHPARASAPRAPVSVRRPVTGGPTVLPVLDQATDGRGARWLKVLLPGRPNGHTGWIPAAATARQATRWRITVDTSSRRVRAYRDGRLMRTYTGIVGRVATPTPHGDFFVEEVVRLAGNEIGAPYALALSARSSVLHQFAGGPGQIALHGTDNTFGLPGTAASHGCVRLSTRAITWLAQRIGPGVRVTITR